jgi:hypothetical protein
MSQSSRCASGRVQFPDDSMSRLKHPSDKKGRVHEPSPEML